MDIETIGIIIGAILGMSAIVFGIMKWLKMIISNIALEVVTRSQSTCEKGRQEEMIALRNDISNLKDSDTSKQLDIVKIKSSLENLEQGHERTQAMLLNLQESFNETTTQLIDAIKSITMRT